MRVSTLCRSVPLLTLALTSAIKAAHDAISQPYPATKDVQNSESGNTTTDDVLSASSGHIHYRINGPGQLAVIYTEPKCPRRLSAQQLYVPGNDTDTPPELLQIEYCSARCMNLPEGVRGQSIELSLAGPIIIIGESPERPYARLYETSDCRGVGKETSIRKSKNWACTDVEDGFWHPAREGGFGSFMVWKGCRYLETEEQKEEKRRNGRLKKERERVKADIEKSRWKAADKERKIQKEEGKMERKLEKQIQKERLKQWEKEQKEKKKQDKQDEKQEEREEILRGKERKAAWDARKAQRKKEMKAQFEEWRQDRLMELKEGGARKRAERKAQRQRGREDRQAELLEMEKQWEQDRRDKVIEDDKEWEEQLANEAIEMARDKEEEEMLEVAEVAAGEEKLAKRGSHQWTPQWIIDQ
ncbi:hypothetical protein VC83_08699 [Pseudogymnoascus destructans]|uniref:Uncharacterized protein n=2 Tax=Pseudogymnoascus destructans TaxID=655981 RepID=L8FSK2_PSED2|nr:uncharacterized protein VC83_08699 [Pseudogymnoascus destructans]ELR02676.1 hypothetical protein GMDG_05630 [Pseudogymnoascus destructans 20631-21]OAF54894.1 hypothetical protein VC83_08699 [Pseudogymnoascus destructans]